MRLAVLVLVALLAGCAHRSSGAELRVRDVAVGEARFRVRWWPGDDRAARQVLRALEKAAPRAARWGPLTHEVTITLHPDHAALESAIAREGHGWLRAWARFRTVDLQSPRSWGLLGARDRRIEELLAHELTHCAMYQRAGDEHTWMYKEIPRWFSEGIATVTAGQGYRYARPKDLWSFYASSRAGSGDGVPDRVRGATRVAALPGDPIVDPDSIHREAWQVVYGAAHHAAEFLMRRYGEARVHRILELMGEGRRFPAAFKEAIGISDVEFASDFRRYIVWEGWRR